MSTYYLRDEPHFHNFNDPNTSQRVERHYRYAIYRDLDPQPLYRTERYKLALDLVQNLNNPRPVAARADGR